MLHLTSKKEERKDGNILTISGRITNCVLSNNTMMDILEKYEDQIIAEAVQEYRDFTGYQGSDEQIKKTLVKMSEDTQRISNYIENNPENHGWEPEHDKAIIIGVTAVNAKFHRPKLGRTKADRRTYAASPYRIIFYKNEEDFHNLFKEFCIQRVIPEYVVVVKEKIEEPAEKQEA